MPSFQLATTPAIVFAVIASMAPTPAAGRTLTFEERVAAQEVIERVYFSQQIGATKPFEQAVPREILETKVRTYLRESVALETFWRTPVTADMLRAELERVARSTRLPDRLLQIYRALDNDPVLVAECFARSILVDRLARSFFAFDPGIHADARAHAEDIRHRLVDGRLDLRAAEPGRTMLEVRRTTDGDVPPPAREHAALGTEARGPGSPLNLDPEAFDRLRARAPRRIGEIGPVHEGRDAFLITVVLAETADSFRLATYSVPKRPWKEWWEEVQWGLDESAVRGEAVDEARLPVPSATVRRGFEFAAFTATAASGATARPESTCVPDDSWDNGALDDLPSAFAQSTVWTGNEMVVWGGALDGTTFVNTGSRYNPLTDTWSSTSTIGAPSGRRDHAAVWAGNLMIVWGGFGGTYPPLNTGGRYDPSTDTWSPTATAGAPSGRHDHTAVWTGSRMVVWGGFQGTLPTVVDTGGAYDPVNDSWTPVSTSGAPAGRYLHTAIWTGSLMVVWGGLGNGISLGTGGRYDPAADTWAPTSTTGAPLGRNAPTAVWTGSRMIVWGGYFNTDTDVNTGGRYDPMADSWAPTSTFGAPSPRRLHSAVWTGSRMVVWGGYEDANSRFVNTGARYNPLTDSWTPTSVTGVPSVTGGHSAVWTGSRMVVWGRDGSSATTILSVDTGGRYDPLTDTWTPTSTLGAPTGRSHHTAVWTGNLMVVWGGVDGTLLASGGRYDPLTDNWTPTSTVGAPSGRWDHTAVWVGNLMVVWGGDDDTFLALDTGGRYDPLTDTWTPTSTVGTPSPRQYHTVVWTGARMVVWGGYGSYNHFDTGGQYDPVSDTWAPTSTLGAPSARQGHTAVWTGRRMVVWGGGPSDTNSGGRYDPVNDAWTATSTINAPSGRSSHTAVWTGNWMVVWGGYVGGGASTGGRYDPVSDTWTPTSGIDVPSGRYSHAAVWTGSRMVVWGGYDGTRTNTGGRYDPVANAWAPTSIAGAPSGRSDHTAVWAGSLMLVWGGFDGTHSQGGGRYSLGEEDGDGDGYRVCDGDCDDRNPATHPGATEVCDGTDDDCNWSIDEGCDKDGDGYCDAAMTVVGTPPACPGGPGDCDEGDPHRNPGVSEACDDRDNDCDGDVDRFTTTCGVGGCTRTGVCVAGFDPCVPGSPTSETCNGVDDDCDGSLPALEGDADRDGTPTCAGDCDDNDPSRHPGAAEACNGVDDDCNGVVPPQEADGDLDGFKACAGDCDDTEPTQFPGNPELCDGLDNDCDLIVPPAEADVDGDGYLACLSDCNDLEAATYPNAPEVSDGSDNQCPGDPGFGLIDEISGIAGFFDRRHPSRFCWPTQAGATSYQVAGSNGPIFAGPCKDATTEQSCISIPNVPRSKAVYFFLVRVVAPHAGSWGQRSTGQERVGICGTEACKDGLDNDGDGAVDCADADCLSDPVCDLEAFTFVDAPGDSVATGALTAFFQASSAGPSSYIHVSITNSVPSTFEWCAQRADAYRDQYLALSATGGQVASGSWSVWYRSGGGVWIGPLVDTYINYYGGSCFGPYSWCSEVGLGGRAATVDPEDELTCEARDAYYGCGLGDWALTIQIGSDRMHACGF